jgi:hypothetical protein
MQNRRHLRDNENDILAKRTLIMPIAGRQRRCRDKGRRIEKIYREKRETKKESKSKTDKQIIADFENSLNQNR